MVPLINAGNFKQVVAITSKSKAAIATVLNYGIARLASARRRDDVEKAMDESLLEIIPRMEKRTHYLSALANIGMLTGLLGTVIGLISAFASIAQANPAEKASLLAASISVAMNNTASGLFVRDHAAAGAHVPGSEDHQADRQPGNRRGEVPELRRRASPGRGRGRRALRRRRAAAPLTASRNSRLSRAGARQWRSPKSRGA